MTPFLKGLDAVNRGFYFVSMMLLMASTILATLNAVTRKFFPGFGGFTWAEELCSYCCVLMLFIGCAYLELTNKHLMIGVVVTLIRNDKARAVVERVLRILRGAVTLFLLGIVVRYGFVVLQNMYTGNLVTYALRWPKLYFFIPMLVGFVMVLIVWASILVINKGKEIDYGLE